MLIKMEAYQEDSTWCACGIGEDIFTQAATADERYCNIKEAVEMHFENGSTRPEIDILIVSDRGAEFRKTS